MNKIIIIGNLTRDPELRTVGSGISVCDFTVAVNRRKKDDNGQQEADFFRVTAWRQLGENCSRFLSKGRKVCVVGAVSARTYEAKDGTTKVSLEVNAEDVEFLSPRDEHEESYQRQERQAIQDENKGFQVVEDNDLPF